MMADRAWVLLPSGRQLDLLTPDPAAWSDRDLAISLSRTYRWGGHSRWDLPLSVAQHSLLVLVMREQMQALQPLTRGIRIPGHAVEQPLHAVGDPIPNDFSHLPAVLAIRLGEQPTQILLGLFARLAAREQVSKPCVKLFKFFLPLL